MFSLTAGPTEKLLNSVEVYAHEKSNKHKYKSITPDEVAAKAAPASQDMSHYGASQAMSQDVSGGDEDTANAADAAPALSAHDRGRRHPGSISA